jgi:hypothetical protein
MSIAQKISGEIAPFFRFATSENPSRIVRQWKNSDQADRMHLAYANCVSCDTNRFKKEELSYLRLGTNTYFCQPCVKKTAEVIKKYDTGIPSEEYEIFTKIWNNSLFGQSKL